MDVTAWSVGLIVFGVLCSVVAAVRIYKHVSAPGKSARLNAALWIDIANNCAEILQTTSDPGVYLNRYDLYIEMLNNLAVAQQSRYIKLAVDITTMLQNMGGRSDQISEFINRAYKKVLEDSNSLKTVSGRNRRIDRFFALMDGYTAHMEPANIALLQSMKTIHIANRSVSATPRNDSVVKSDKPVNKNKVVVSIDMEKTEEIRRKSSIVRDTLLAEADNTIEQVPAKPHDNAAPAILPLDSAVDSNTSEEKHTTSAVETSDVTKEYYKYFPTIPEFGYITGAEPMFPYQLDADYTFDETAYFVYKHVSMEQIVKYRGRLEQAGFNCKDLNPDELNAHTGTYADDKYVVIIRRRVGEPSQETQISISLSPFAILCALKEKESAVNDIIGLHFYYNKVIEFTYKNRDMDGYLDTYVEYCKKDVAMFPEFRDAYVQRFHLEERGLHIRMPSFERLVIIYDKQGDFEEAVNICELAISYGLKDSTKNGFEGRLKTLKTKLLKAQTQSNSRKKPIVVSVDMGNIEKIRHEALDIQERLVVEDDNDITAGQIIAVSETVIELPSASGWSGFVQSLTQIENDALRIVLQAGNIRHFSIENGVMLEVLVDGINEKALDTIGDNILESDDDDIVLYPDYENELRGTLRLDAETMF